MNQKIATRGRNLGRAGTARRPLPATVSLPLKRDDGGRCLPYQYLKGVFATVSNQLPMNPRPETVPTLPLPLGEDGPKGRVRERPPGSRTQFVAEAPPGGLPMNLRPEAAPTFPLPPGEGGPKGRVRERPPGSWAQFVAGARPGGLPMNLRPEATPTFPLPPGEGGPKGRVRERPPGSWAQFVAGARPGGLSLSLFARTRFFAHLALLLLLLLPLGAIHAQSVSITPGTAPGTSTPMPTTDYTEDHDDLSVKVMGGQIVIRRAYMDKQWYANRAWAPLKLTFDSIDGSVKEISGLSNVYKKTADGVYTFGKRLYIRQTATGFRWANRTGDWIDYDAQGNITAYGDRNDVKVSFEYQTTNGVSRLTGLFDHFGTKVLTFTYTGNQLTAVQDYANRKVQYVYNLDGNLTQVIDVLGNIWNYVYVAVQDGFRLTSRTDPEGRTITLAFAANGFNAGK